MKPQGDKVHHGDLSFPTFKVINITQTKLLHQVCHGEEDSIIYSGHTILSLHITNGESMTYFTHTVST